MLAGWGFLFDTNLTVSSVPRCCNLDLAMRLLQRWWRNLRAWGLLKVLGDLFITTWFTSIAVANFEKRDWVGFCLLMPVILCLVWHLRLIITGRRIRFPLALRDSVPAASAIRIFLAVIAFCSVSAFAAWFSLSGPQYADGFKDGLLLVAIICAMTSITTYFLSYLLSNQRKPYL